MVTKECEYCHTDYEVIVFKVGPKKGLPKRPEQRFCSRKCLNNWQRIIKWEDRVGKETADKIRKATSERVSGLNNPSCKQEVADKISKSLKKTLSENKDMREGENNPFYGHKHTEAYKKWAHESRKGIRSYTDEGYENQLKNTPKLENHPNWKGGISFEDYDFAFNDTLKNKIKKRDNFECQICGKKDGLMHIHHIDYDKHNSVEENLITLCNSCHSKTNWRRESWIKFFSPIMEAKYKS